MPQRAGLRCEIVRWITDEPLPGLVEARFTDAHGRVWSVTDKSAVFTDEPISAHTEYPLRGVLRCEILGRGRAAIGTSVVRVRTIDTDADGVTKFEVSETALDSL